MSRIQLFFRYVTEVVGNENEGLLVLTDTFQERQLIIPCSGSELEEFRHRLAGNTTQDHLTDVLWKIIRWQTNIDLEIVISGVTNGVYTALLSNTNTLDQVALSATEAVLLGYISKEKVPIYIDEKLFLRQSSRFDSKSKDLSIPVNSLSLPMLRKALGNALESEKYELASQIRDEIKKREGINNADNKEEA